MWWPAAYRSASRPSLLTSQPPAAEHDPAGGDGCAPEAGLLRDFGGRTGLWRTQMAANASGDRLHRAANIVHGASMGAARCPAAFGCPIGPAETGRVVEIDEVGGLHHHYERAAA